MNLPGHYKTFFRTQLRFAIGMATVAVLAGISFQESGRKLVVGPAMPAGAHLEYLITLALVHGHLFLTGVLLPLAFCWMLHLELALGAEPVPAPSLAWTTRLYLPGAAATSLLQLVKGYHFVLGGRHGAQPFAALDASFLGGSHVLRAAAFGLAHGALGLGMAILGVQLWRRLGTARVG